MASVVVRRLDEEVKERLRTRAEKHGRSLEAEVREILMKASLQEDDGANPHQSDGKGFGTLMHELFGKRGLTPREQRRLDRALCELRDRSMMRIPDFEEW